MRKGFLIYEEMRKYFPIYEEAVSHIWVCNYSIRNFLIYEENLIFCFISASIFLLSHTTLYSTLSSPFPYFANHLSSLLHISQVTNLYFFTLPFSRQNSGFQYPKIWPFHGVRASTPPRPIVLNPPSTPPKDWYPSLGLKCWQDCPLNRVSHIFYEFLCRLL